MNDQNTIKRKAKGERGQRTQTMMTFRCDNENVEWLSQQPNKGRYINKLIARDRQLHEEY